MNDRCDTLSYNYDQEKRKYEVTKLTLNEVVDKLDRTTDQYNVILGENDKLKTDVKTLQADNSLLFKKVVSLQDQLMQIYNEKAQAEAENKKCNCHEEEEKGRNKRTMSMIEKIDDDLEFEMPQRVDEDMDKLKKLVSFTLPSRPIYKKVVDE